MRGVVGGQFQENFFQAQANAAQFKERPAILHDFCGDGAARVGALLGFDNRHQVPVTRKLFRSHAGSAGEPA